MLSHTVSVGQEFSNSLVELFWLNIYHWSEVTMSAGPQVLTGDGGPISDVPLTRLASCRTPQFLTTWISAKLHDCLPDMGAFFLRMSDLRESKAEGTLSLMTASKVALHHFWNILLITQVTPIQCGRDDRGRAL